VDYFAIIKKAFQISARHKFLWIFGILAGGYGGFRGFSFNTSSYSATGSQWQKTFNNLNSLTFNQFWANWGSFILAILFLLLVLALIIFILNIISQGALVNSVAKINKNEKANFKIGFLAGAHQFWRILGVIILYLLMTLASLVLLIAPVVFFVSSKMYALAIIWGLILFLVDLLFWILIGLISPYSIRVAVLEKFSVFQSIRESLHFVRDNLKEVIIMYLLMFAIGIGYGIALLLAILLAGGLLLAIGFGFYLASAIVAISYGIVVGLVVFIGLIIVSGAYNTFTSSVLTLVYLELAKKTNS